jgi:hypothetical protein
MTLGKYGPPKCHVEDGEPLAEFVFQCPWCGFTVRYVRTLNSCHDIVHDAFVASRYMIEYHDLANCQVLP